jgi:hypothetical protein
MSDSVKNIVLSSSMYYGIITALIGFAALHILQPLIVCFLDPIKRCLCGCCIRHNEEVADEECITDKDVIKQTEPQATPNTTAQINIPTNMPPIP